jgi:putative ABC transport system substrate-binding protein
MRRRDFITLLGGAAAWPLAARAQQADRARRIGVLIGGDENDPLRKSFVSALTQALADLGWTDGHNARMDLRWAGADINRIQVLAQEVAHQVRNGREPQDAKALGLTVPQSILLRADEVIE